MFPRGCPGGWRGFAALASTILLLGAAPPVDSEVAKKLALPASPGAIALLAAQGRAPGVAEKLQSALVDPNPDVRGVAARVVDVAGLSELVPEVSKALGKETDLHAALEQARVLCALGGPSYDAEVLAAAARLSPSLNAGLVRTVARVRGPAALSLYFDKLHELAMASSDRKAFFRIASRGQRESLNAAAALALSHGDAPSFEAAVRVATELGLTLEQPLFVQAMRTDKPSFRGEAAWYLAKTYCGRPPEGAGEMLAAATETGAATPAGSDPEERFGVEMLRRVLGTPPVEDEAWIACLESNLDCHLDSDLDESPLVEFLTPREREAVVNRNTRSLESGERSGSTRSVGKAPGLALRLVGGLPHGLARALFQMEGCRPRTRMEQIAIAEMRFRTDGVPKNISMGAVPKGKTCEDIATALFTMSLAPDESVGPDMRMTYLSLFDADSAECGEDESVASGSAVPFNVLRVRATVKAPKLLKKFEPFYPESARAKGQEGVSIYEAIITEAGCVREVRLLRSSTPMLDVVGMEAVARWKYSPATLDGRPIRVFLTVTVTYSLHRK